MTTSPPPLHLLDPDPDTDTATARDPDNDAGPPRDPVHPSVTLTAHALPEIALARFLGPHLEGREPHLVRLVVDGPVAPRHLVPDDFTEVALTRDRQTLSLVARGPGASLHLRSGAEGTEVHLSAADPDHLDRLRRTVAAVPTADPPGHPVSIWSIGRFGPQSTSERLTLPAWDDVAANYPAATRTDLDRTMARPQSGGRLILWRGPPGTGKTHAVRALVAAWSDWCDAHLITDAERFFSSTDSILGVLHHGPGTSELSPDEPITQNHRPRLLVVEDADAILGDSSTTDDQLSRLLNLTDGIVGQSTDAYLLLTTNLPPARLNPAVVRPGRCLADIEFRPFEHHEATAWLDRPVEPGRYTLAELFAARLEDRSPEPEEPGLGQYL